MRVLFAIIAFFFVYLEARLVGLALGYANYYKAIDELFLLGIVIFVNYILFSSAYEKHLIDSDQ
jgi:hypothetical protein